MKRRVSERNEKGFLRIDRGWRIRFAARDLIIGLILICARAWKSRAASQPQSFSPRLNTHVLGSDAEESFPTHPLLFFLCYVHVLIHAGSYSLLFNWLYYLSRISCLFLFISFCICICLCPKPSLGGECRGGESRWDEAVASPRLGFPPPSVRVSSLSGRPPPVLCRAGAGRRAV